MRKSIGELGQNSFMQQWRHSSHWRDPRKECVVKTGYPFKELGIKAEKRK